MYNDKYIGVFDSGVGGLTALEDLKKNFPNENFLYLGDTLRCPYGTKTKEELEKIVESDIKYLEDCDCKMIIIACNTATANSYHINSNVPIIRIIEPTCEVANESDGSLIVLATNYTVNSKAYSRFLKKDHYQVPCSEWVEIIEKGKTNSKESFDSAYNLLKDYQGKIDNAILACTHFGLMEKEIKAVLGENVNIINSSKCLSAKVKEALDKVGYNSLKEKAKLIIRCTNNKEAFNVSWLSLKYDSLEETKI